MGCYEGMEWLCGCKYGWGWWEDGRAEERGRALGIKGIKGVFASCVMASV